MGAGASKPSTVILIENICVLIIEVVTMRTTVTLILDFMDLQTKIIVKTLFKKKISIILWDVMKKKKPVS